MISKALIGRRIRTARQRQFPRVRQRDVDDIVGIPRGRTAHYENGRAAAPHAYLVTLSEKWQIPIGWFLQTEIDELPAIGTSGATSGGMARIELRGDLLACQVEPAIAGTTIEVDGRFHRAGCFGCRMIGNEFAPKVQHGDIIVFWPTDRARVGIVSFASSPNASVAVLPTQAHGTVELQFPYGELPSASEYSVTAYAVGVVRSLTEGDMMVLSNTTGLRFQKS
jgi:hypothetical protein